MRLAPDDGAAERQRHDAEFHVFVYAGKPLGLNPYAGLFQHFPCYPVGGRFGQFETAAWWDPPTVIAPLYGENSAVIAEHDPGHTH